jgi:hypothetical protein
VGLVQEAHIRGYPGNVENGRYSALTTPFVSPDQQASPSRVALFPRVLFQQSHPHQVEQTFISPDQITVGIPDNITLRLSDNPTRNKQQLIGNVVDFATKVTRGVKGTLTNNLIHRKVDRTVIDYMQTMKLDQPLITIADGDEANETLEYCGFPQKNIYAHEVLTVIRLPEPVHEVNAWARMYKPLTDNIWDEIRRQEKDKDMKFKRVNRVGDHDVDKYWYVFRTSK